jgi:hypothetical protein
LNARAAFGTKRPELFLLRPFPRLVNASGNVPPRFTPQPDNSSAMPISQLQTRQVTYRQKYIGDEAIAVPGKGNCGTGFSERAVL